MFDNVQRKKENKKPIKRRDSFFANWRFEFDFKKSFKIILISLLILSLIAGAVFFLMNYKADRYQINNLKYVNQEKVSTVVNTYLNSETFLRINTNDLENEIKPKSKLIKEIKISKSLINGIIVDIVEYEPIIVIDTADGKKYFITSSDELIDYDMTENIGDLPEFHYTGSDLKDNNLFKLASRAKSLADKLKGTVQGNFNFDNFGNLFILQEGNKVIRFDLNENFFTLDEQVQLLHDAMSKKPEFTEIDIRFSYLLIK